MTKTYVNINKHVIAANRKHGRNDPPVRAQRGRSGKARYGHRAIIHGPSEVVYDPDNPLKCGARLWIETEADVDVI